MKTVAEGICFIKANYQPNDEIPYSAIEEFMEISGVSFLERQRMRVDYAKRLNTSLRKGQTFNEDSGDIYTSLWVNERGKSYVLIPLSQMLLKDSQRAYTSVANRLDDVLYEYARALGLESYKSIVRDEEVKFRGLRPLLSNDEVKVLTHHFEMMQMVAPMIQTADRAANAASRALSDLIGPKKQIGHDGNLSEAA